MAGWESLRVDLLRLREESPDALVMWPSPDIERRSERRFPIELAAWATEIASTLKATYDDLVDLRVGAMTFPAGELWAGGDARQVPAPPAEAVGLEVETVSAGGFPGRGAPEPYCARPHWHRRDGSRPWVRRAARGMGLVIEVQTDDGHMWSAPLEITVTP